MLYDIVPDQPHNQKGLKQTPSLIQLTNQSFKTAKGKHSKCAKL